jgi:hypothetical protein
MFLFLASTILANTSLSFLTSKGGGGRLFGATTGWIDDGLSSFTCFLGEGAEAIASLKFLNFFGATLANDDDEDEDDISEGNATSLFISTIEGDSAAATFSEVCIEFAFKNMFVCDIDFEFGFLSISKLSLLLFLLNVPIFSK